jgi:predicted nucleic acid-binding protein
MVLVGSAHPLKSTAAAIVRRLSLAQEKLVTDAEVLQEILHRYVSINRPEAIKPAFDALSQVVVEVFPIDLNTVHDARALVLG